MNEWISSTKCGRAQPSNIEGQLKTYILRSIQQQQQHKYVTDQNRNDKDAIISV